MKAWRKTHKEKKRRRSRDEEQRAEARAVAYVDRYLKRRRIVPPRRCDVCGLDTAVQFYHPNPPAERVQDVPPADRERVRAQLRALLWLCPEDRKDVIAGQRAVVAQWSWPGPIDPLPTGSRRTRFILDSAWVAAANGAVPSDLPSRALPAMWGDAFFRAAGAAERRAVLTAGLRRLAKDATAFASWQIYGDERVDALLRRWVRGQHSEYEAEKARIVARPLETDEDRLADFPVLRSRKAARSRDRRAPTVASVGVVPSIGPVPVPPSTPPWPAQPPRSVEEEAALLDRFDAQLSEFDRNLDAILARVASVTPPAKRRLVVENDD
jgi:hypothetical protein